MTTRDGRIAHRLIFLALALLACPAAGQEEQTAAPAVPAKPGMPTALAAELGIERRLLVGDVGAYVRARSAEEGHWQRARDLGRQLDETLGQETPGVQEIERLEASLLAARSAGLAAAQRADHLRAAIVERLRRITLLEDDLGLLAASLEPAANPLGGRWRVTIGPAGEQGVFSLGVNGTLVEGTYRLDDGRSGSLKGIYADRILYLERLDRERGFDATFRATVDPAAGRMSGLWQPLELAPAGSSGGEWQAERLPDEQESSP